MPEATAATVEPLIAVDRVTKRFGRDPEPALDELSLAIARNETVTVIGPSGCGKSTLLNLIAGIATPTSGRVEIADKEVRIAYVFQQPRLLPWRKVLGNVQFGLEQRRRRGSMSLGSPRIEERARDTLRLVNLSGHEDKYPHQLSGGMQQRVALARGLAVEPHVLLLDEPFGALDALTRGYLQEELLGIVRRTDATTVLVTHDIDEALLLGDRVIVLSSRPGRIKSVAEIPFGSQGSVDALLTTPGYAELRTHLREQLRPEVHEKGEAHAAGELATR